MKGVLRYYTRTKEVLCGDSFISYYWALLISVFIGVLAESFTVFASVYAGAITSLYLYLSYLFDRGERNRSRIQQMSVIPTCMYCGRVRVSDVTEEWVDVEMFIAAGAQSMMSHGICKDCRKRVEEEMDNFLNGEDK